MLSPQPLSPALTRTVSATRVSRVSGGLGSVATAARPERSFHGFIWVRFAPGTVNRRHKVFMQVPELQSVDAGSRLFSFGFVSQKKSFFLEVG